MEGPRATRRNAWSWHDGQGAAPERSRTLGEVLQDGNQPCGLKTEYRRVEVSRPLRARTADSLRSLAVAPLVMSLSGNGGLGFADLR